MAVSFKAKKIAILELCRRSDTSPGQLQAAYKRKINLCGPQVEALGHYSNSGWSVKILSWVVGARGLVQERDMHHALEYIVAPNHQGYSSGVYFGPGFQAQSPILAPCTCPTFRGHQSESADQ